MNKILRFPKSEKIIRDQEDRIIKKIIRKTTKRIIENKPTSDIDKRRLFLIGYHMAGRTITKENKL